MKIEAQSELERLTQAREAEMKYIKEQNDLEISKAREMADIETGKFNNMVSAIGANTIQAIATSGPEMQVCSDIHYPKYTGMSKGAGDSNATVTRGLCVGYLYIMIEGS